MKATSGGGGISDFSPLGGLLASNMSTKMSDGCCSPEHHYESSFPDFPLFSLGLQRLHIHDRIPVHWFICFAILIAIVIFIYILFHVNVFFFVGLIYCRHYSEPSLKQNPSGASARHSQRPSTLSPPAATARLSAERKETWSSAESFEDSEGTACIRPPGGGKGAGLIAHGRSSGAAPDEQRGGATSDQYQQEQTRMRASLSAVAAALGRPLLSL